MDLKVLRNGLIEIWIDLLIITYFYYTEDQFVDFLE